jgi:hypothetical protein
MSWKVSGSTNLPLGDREREWDQEAARDHIFRWAGWEDNPQPGKAKRAFFAYDDESPENLTSYKLPFADVVDGELKAMPRGLFAVAQLLRGARDGVGVPEAVLRSARRKVTTYYHKMGEEAPWEEEPGARKEMPGKLTPAKRRKTVRAGRAAARTRARRGTQPHGRRKMTAQEKKKRARAARTAARTRARHTG